MSSTEKKLPQLVLDFLKNQGLKGNEPLIVALSGGPDSTALLLALTEINRNYRFSIAAAYVNHGMRDEEELLEDDLFVAKLAERLGVPLHTLTLERGEVSRLVRDEGRSAEDVARQFRYDFFTKVCRDYNDPYLLLGHNLDDQMETIITRFLQGSGVRGLKGIPHRNGTILRPLIHIRKRDILSYLETSGETWRTDPTNSRNDYLRNSVRNRLLPVIEEIFPGIETSLLCQEKRFADLDSATRQRADNLRISLSPGCCSIPLAEFNRADKFTRLDVLYRMFDSVYSGDVKGFRVPVSFFNPLLDGPVLPERKYAEGHTVELHTRKTDLVMMPLAPAEEGFFVSLVPGDNSIPGWRIICSVSRKGTPVPVCEGSPLVFRSAIAGDIIETEKGRKALKDISRQWGAGRKLDRPLPLLEDSQGIAAVFGETEGFENIYRKKKIITSRKFNILYLEVGRESM